LEVKELYRQILCIDDTRKVSHVELDVKEEMMDVKVVHVEGEALPILWTVKRLV